MKCITSLREPELWCAVAKTRGFAPVNAPKPYRTVCGDTIGPSLAAFQQNDLMKPTCPTCILRLPFEPSLSGDAATD